MSNAFGPPPDRDKAAEWIATHWVEAYKLSEAIADMKKRVSSLVEQIHDEVASLVALGVISTETAYTTSKGILCVYPDPGNRPTCLVSKLAK